MRAQCPEHTATQPHSISIVAIDGMYLQPCCRFEYRQAADSRGDPEACQAHHKTEGFQTECLNSKPSSDVH